MKLLRYFTWTLSALIGLWVPISFIAVIVDPSNVDFWTNSLMWSLLAGLVIMPLLLVVYHATEQTRARSAQQDVQPAEPVEEQTPFIEEEDREGRLWPYEETSADRR